MEIRFDGRVAIVTGAGNGLGRSHALALAARGARVVVNDLGASLDGSGGSSDAAEAVVKEIRAAGGEAIANGANVTDYAQVEAMVRQAMETWGQVDILVNNAGILRDKTFTKVTVDDFNLVLDVHLMGSVNCTKAVWEIMREQNYGRITMTTSSSGLYGNFGQSNYAAAKMGVVGLMNTLRLEGAKYNIRVNALSPTAATRMTYELMPKELHSLLSPESVTPGLLFLVSEEAPQGEILCAGAGSFARTRIYESRGMFLGGDNLSPEKVAANWERISDTEGQEDFVGGGNQTTKFVTLALEAQKQSKD